MSNELKEIIKEIQYRTDKTLETIADDIGYSRAYLNNQVNKGKNEKLKEVLIRKYGLKNKQNVPHEIHNSSVAPMEVEGTSFATPQLATLLTNLMQKQNQLMEMQNKILADTKEDLIEKVKEIHVNSKSTISYLQAILRVNRADDAVIMDNQDEQAGREVGSSARQAGNLEIAAAQDQVKKDTKMQHGAHK